MNTTSYKAILADLDGTVNRGNVLIPGAEHTYRILSDKGLRWLFLSNNAALLPSDIAFNLTSLGLPVAPDRVLSSASALIRALTREESQTRVMVIGQPRLIRGIQDAGVYVTEDPSETDMIAVALDRGFTYEKLKLAHRAIQRGARFWATNLDPTFPVPDGFEPGAGSIAAAVAAVAGRPPDRVFGKPSTDLADMALEVLELTPAECLVVGDRMDTDILFARNAGMDSALVLTGATSRERLKDFDFAPDYVFDDIVDLASLFD